MPVAPPQGEEWTITLTPVGSTSQTTFSASSDGSQADLAAALVTAFDAKNSTAYTVTSSSGTVHVTSSAPFTGTFAVAPSGSATTGSVYTHTVTVDTASADDWTATLTEIGGAAIGTPLSVTGSTDADTLAGNLAAAISGVSGFTAIAEGDQVTITRRTGTDFNISFSASAGGTATPASAYAQAVTLEQYVGQGVTFTLDGTPYTPPAANADNAGDAATWIAGQIGSGYTVALSPTQPTFVIVRLDGGSITASLTAGESGSVASSVTTGNASGTLTLPTVNAADKVTVTLTQGSTVVTKTDTEAALAGDFSGSGFTISANGLVLTVTGTGMAAITYTLSVAEQLPAVQSAETVALTGDAVAGDTWSVALTNGATGLASYQVDEGTDTGDTLDTVASALAGVLRSQGLVAEIGPGDVLTITAAGGAAFTTAASVVSGGAATTTTATTTTLGLSGTANQGDVWTITVNGANYAYTVQSGNGTSNVAAGLACKITAALGTGCTNSSVAGYTAFASGSTLYLTKIAGGTLTASLAVTRNPVAVEAVGLGTPSITWTQDVALVAGAPGFTADETWTVTAGSATHTVSNTTDPAGVLATAFGAGTTCTVSTIAACFELTSSQTPLLISVNETRPAESVDPNTTTTQTDARDHYSTAVFALTGSWVDNETWTLTVNGKTYTYLVNGCAGNTVVDGCILEAGQNLVTIADGLAAAVNAGGGPITATVDDVGDITLKDTSAGDADPFYFTASERSGSVEGAFHLADANDVSGTIQVAAVNPLYAWVLSVFPFLAPYFESNQTLGYTATPVLELYQNITDSHGNVTGHTLLAESTCSAAASRACTVTYYDASGNPMTVLSSSATSDPLIDYLFTEAGTYELEVASDVIWNTSTDQGTPNTFKTSGIQSVPTGMNYQLYASLQGHAVNPNQFSFVGDQITIVSGAGAGETATITGYDPRQSLFDIANSGWTVAPNQTSTFVIEDNLGNVIAYQQQLTKAPDSDAYDLVLTEPLTGSQTVTIDVTPQPTPTYDAAEAFDSAANNGQNDLVQVAVSTPWVTFTLGGTPLAGETWTLIIGTTSYQYLVKSTDTLTDILNALAALLPAAQYTVTVNTTNDTISVHTINGTSFRAGSLISGDPSGTTTQGSIGVTAQLVFDASNWDTYHAVTVHGVPDFTVDGTDALVFPPLPNTVDEIRGPITIVGGNTAQVPALETNPLMLPGETNLPLANGTLGTRQALNRQPATRRSPTTERHERERDRRPAPRLRPAHERLPVHGRAPQRRRRRRDARRRLGLAGHPLVREHDADPGRPEVRRRSSSPARPSSTARRTSRSSARSRGRRPTSRSRGIPTVGDTWELTIDGQLYSVVVTAANDIPSLLAEALLAQIRAGPAAARAAAPHRPSRRQRPAPDGADGGRRSPSTSTIVPAVNRRGAQRPAASSAARRPARWRRPRRLNAASTGRSPPTASLTHRRVERHVGRSSAAPAATPSARASPAAARSAT